MLVGAEKQTCFFCKATSDLHHWAKKSGVKSYLCEVEFQFLPSELGLMKLYPCTGCRFGVTEIYSDTSETLKQLERDALVISPEQSLKFFLIKNKHRKKSIGCGSWIMSSDKSRSPWWDVEDRKLKQKAQWPHSRFLSLGSCEKEKRCSTYTHSTLQPTLLWYRKKITNQPTFISLNHQGFAFYPCSIAKMP